MEPRPPRPRSPHPFDASAAPASSGVGERLYPGSGDAAQPVNPEAYGAGLPEGPLLPRQQRRQRGALRGIAATIVLLVLVAVLGWLFRDAILGAITPPQTSPTPMPEVAAPATPTGEPALAELPNALATVTPTAAVATNTPHPSSTTVSAQANETPPPASDVSAQTRPLLAFLPTQEQVPAGLVLTAEAERSKAEVVDSLGGSDEAAQLLDDWGWSGNAFREFTGDEANAAPGAMTYLNVSVHRFADAASAANALTFFSDQVIFGQGLQEVDAPAVGEAARLLVGAPVAVLYVQDGPILYRFGASASGADSDPSQELVTLAQSVIPSGGG
jgi:hypothetical protein